MALTQIGMCQNDGDVRIEGRYVESYNYYASEWLPICQRSINKNEANAICRQLGKKSASYISVNEKCEARYGIDLSSNTKNFYMQRQCSDKENLKQCIDRYVINLWGKSDCQENECFSIECTSFESLKEEQNNFGIPSGKNVIGDIALSQSEQLYYFTGKFWDPVCSTTFRQKDAKSACKQLGYDELIQTNDEECYFPENKGYRNYNFQDVFCNSIESNLKECQVSPSNTCKQSFPRCVRLECKNKDWTPIIIASVVGALIFILIVVCCAWAIYRKRLQQKQIKIQQQQNQIIIAQQQQQQQIFMANQQNNGIYQQGVYYQNQQLQGQPMQQQQNQPIDQNQIQVQQIALHNENNDCQENHEQAKQKYPNIE